MSKFFIYKFEKIIKQKYEKKFLHYITHMFLFDLYIYHRRLDKKHILNIKF